MSDFVQAIVAAGLFNTAIVAIVFGRDFWGKGPGVEVNVKDPK
jgi:hypothetical protein